MLQNKSFFTQKRAKNHQAWHVLRPLEGHVGAGWFWGLFLAFFTLLNLSACGFHLKGMDEKSAVDFKTIQLTKTEGVRADIMLALKQLLKSYKIEEVSTEGKAEVVVAFQPTQYTASRTGLTAQGDTASELLKMAQPIQAKDVQADKQIVEATVQSFRDRRINNSAALASNRELQNIQRQMAQDIAGQILDRIARARNNEKLK